MSLLIDTHVFLALLRRDTARLGPGIEGLLLHEGRGLALSAASLWEIAIKWRLGKLPLHVEPQHLAELAEAMGIGLLAITARHVCEELESEPPTRDPFDRLLLAQCQAENMALVTIDRALDAHPLAWRQRK